MEHKSKTAEAIRRLTAAAIEAIERVKAGLGGEIARLEKRVADLEAISIDSLLSAKFADYVGLAEKGTPYRKGTIARDTCGVVWIAASDDDGVSTTLEAPLWRHFYMVTGKPKEQS